MKQEKEKKKRKKRFEPILVLPRGGGGWGVRGGVELTLPCFVLFYFNSFEILTIKIVKMLGLVSCYISSVCVKIEHSLTSSLFFVKKRFRKKFSSLKLDGSFTIL